LSFKELFKLKIFLVFQAGSFRCWMLQLWCG